MHPERRAFLSGRASRKSPLRPPGSIEESAYRLRCNGCGDCVTACPSGIVVLAEGRAELDFSRGECTLCGRCSQACKREALLGETPAPSRLRASIGPDCLTVRGIECRVCEDQCVPRAIRFAASRGGVRLPHVDRQRCNGCGACFAPCPSVAIEFTSLSECNA